MLVLCSGMENVCVDCILLRSADREVRGIVYGVANAFGYFGMLIFSISGGILFDSVGPYSPFMLVGATDLTFSILAILMACCGCIKNDNLDREVQRRLNSGE